MGLKFSDALRLSWSNIAQHKKRSAVIVLTISLLFGVIMGWKWTYEANSWKQNALREILGAGMYRFCIGAILAISIGITLYLYSIAG